MEKVTLGSYKGTVTKSLTVTSNDPKNPSYRLSTKFTIQPIIEAIPSNISLSDCASRRCKAEITLKTKKNDLEVKAVKFKFSKPANTAQWQQEVPLYVDYEISKGKPDSTQTYTLYTLSLSSDKMESGATSGTFVIDTNHPKKKELEVGGSIAGKM
jgi:hypothetical protein